MRKSIYILFVMIISFGCRQESDELKMEVLSTNQSGCNGQKSVAITNDDEKWIVSSVDENFKFEHIDASFNCCLPDGIKIDVYQSNDTLYYCDSEKTQGNCKCICTYNTLAEVGSLAPGNYVLCFITGESCRGSIELTIEKGMYEEIALSELTENE